MPNVQELGLKLERKQRPRRNRRDRSRGKTLPQLTGYASMLRTTPSIRYGVYVIIQTVIYQTLVDASVTIS